MRPILVLVATALLATIAPTSAGAATTPNFNFKHNETNGRTGPTVAGGGERECASDALCTYEMHEFTIAAGEENGSFAISVTWAGLPGQEGSDTQNDYDLYVYRVATNPEGEEVEVQVASGATGGTTEETASLLSSVNAPIAPGKYRIYVDNFKVSPDTQEWEGYAAFEPFAVLNQRPLAALTAPSQANAGQQVILDASASSDADGTIENFAWDVDGNGSFDVDGPSPTYPVTFSSGGRKHVGVRVRDNAGDVEFAAQTINVTPPSGPDRIQEVPPPPGAITIDIDPRQAFSRFRLRGVAASVGCPSACEILGSLRISSATARRLRLGRRARNIAGSRRELSGAGATPRLALKPRGRVLRRILRSRRSFSAVVRLKVTADGYAPQSFARRVTITR